MLTKPSGCTGCGLHREGLGFMQIDGQPELGVTLMGEALGEQEAKEGLPFKGAAGFRLARMIERAGYKRSQFQILNAVWCQPPKNRDPHAHEIDHCRRYWEHLVERPETKVIVPMGNVPLFALTGREGILGSRGYVEWSDRYQSFILPTVHPSFIMRGQSPWEAAFLYDLRHAVDVAATGWQPVDRDYTLDPPPHTAWSWVERYLALLRTWPALALAYDLETPDKGDAEDEVNINLGFLAGPIYRCGYAYIHPETKRTVAISLPWDPTNFGRHHRALLGSAGPKVVCYRHFDNPRIAAHGVVLAGAKHDVQEMWHVLFSHQRRKLEFIAPFTVPGQPRWKHLNHGESAALYNAIDAGVEVESYYRLIELLHETRLWEVYQRDVAGLNPLLLFMSAKGMPIDLQRRKEASKGLMILIAAVQEKLNATAAEVRPEKVYAKPREGTSPIEVDKEEAYCTECGKKANKKHIHFRCGVAPGEVPLGELRQRTIRVVAYSLPLDFKPSTHGLIRYAEFKGYKLITHWDKHSQSRKISMDETAIRQYALRHETDPIWPLALEERELKKLLGTYTGYLTDAPAKVKSADNEWFEAWRAAQFRESEDALHDRHPRLTPLPEPQYRPDGTFKGSAVEDDDIPF